MLELTEGIERLAPLFDPNIPNHPMLFGILHGRNLGQVVVDQTTAPQHAAIRTMDGLLFTSRSLQPAFLQEAINHFRATGHVGLVWPARTDLTPPEAAQVIRRREFSTRAADSHLWVELKRLAPEQGEVRLADKALLERCRWRPALEAVSGSLDRYLNFGLSVCLVHGPDILAEAHAPFWGQGVVEIGVTTHKAYRGQGYASVVCAHLIEACEQRGCQTYWSCDADNIASVRLAAKLGYSGERDYDILVYPLIA